MGRVGAAAVVAPLTVPFRLLPLPGRIHQTRKSPLCHQLAGAEKVRSKGAGWEQIAPLPTLPSSHSGRLGLVVLTQKLDRDWQTEGVFRVEELEETKKALSKSGESAEPGNEWLP